MKRSCKIVFVQKGLLLFQYRLERIRENCYLLRTRHYFSIYILFRTYCSEFVFRTILNSSNELRANHESPERVFWSILTEVVTRCEQITIFHDALRVNVGIHNVRNCTTGCVVENRKLQSSFRSETEFGFGV